MLRSSLYEIRMLDEEEDPLVVEEETLKSSAEDEVTFISKWPARGHGNFKLQQAKATPTSS